jgi:hypothetical protein
VVTPRKAAAFSTMIEIAKGYIGETEKPNNSGWSDELFQKRMEEAGWQKGQAWCAYFVEMVAKQAYQRDWWKLQNLFSGSAVETFKNFKAAGYKISDKPVADSIVIWQKQEDGKPTIHGHAAICIEAINDTTFKSIEGNTIPDGATGDSREGYIVALKKRTVKKVTNGLQVLGFIIIN